MAFLNKLCCVISDFLWQYPILAALVFTHVFMTIYLKFPQRKILQSIKLSVSKDDGSRSGFMSLAMTLAATLGTGNITGVFSAIALGGPGAVFWCWLTGVFGMATSYAECYLGCLYREKDANGFHGGHMYALKKGLNRPHMARFYAVCVFVSALGTGAATQSNALAQAASVWCADARLCGLAAAVFTAAVILGGAKSIGKVCSKTVPVLGAVFAAGCAVILTMHASSIPDAVCMIIRNAFVPSSVIKGCAAGGLGLAMRYGAARGVFTNEAGLGTAAIGAAASSKSPKTQALIQMSAVFWDTVVMCALTGLIAVIWVMENGDSPYLSFNMLPVCKGHFLSVCLTGFATATLIGWSYFGEEAAGYLKIPVVYYKMFYLFMIYAGAVCPMELVWNLSDLINALLIIPGLICLFGLRKELKI